LLRIQKCFFFLGKLLFNIVYILFTAKRIAFLLYSVREQISRYLRYLNAIQKAGMAGTHGNGCTKTLVIRSSYNSPALFRDLQMSLIRRESDTHVTHYSFTVMISVFNLTIERDSLSLINPVNLRKTRNKL
jgi:hypothetical protein